jgi:hypothetical protein
MMMRKPSQIVSMTSCLSRSGVNQFLPRLAMLNAEVRQGVRVVSHGDGQDLAPRQDACYTRWPGHCLAPKGACKIVGASKFLNAKLWAFGKETALWRSWFGG